ncbi:hypothetical protein AVEN_104510-1 [Araneus ventricosus]|uniref:Uncharacterized protein n=1 Tax=Araneus ventricosus TaxID=182803 RepID=A0A4Y2M6S5_ARAVE|nr:hypothetical protein AVEN_104510-1 [Araneus ventricosus]
MVALERILRFALPVGCPIYLDLVFLEEKLYFFLRTCADPTRFQNYNKILLDATRAVCDLTMQKAAKEAIVENNSDKNIAVAVDGTWQKRGYTWYSNCYQYGHW